MSTSLAGAPAGLRALAVVLLLVVPLAPGVTAMPSGPILITGDEGPTGFILGREPITGSPIYRPGSGVSAGEGTKEDPFVITALRTIRIELRDTRAHVLISDNEVVGEPLVLSSMVVLSNVTNVTLSGNLLHGGSRGILVRNSSDVVLTENTIQGTAVGLAFLGTMTGSVVQGNRIEGEVYVQGEGANRILGNVFSRPGWLVLDGSDASEIVGNTIGELILAGSDANKIMHNTIGWLVLDGSDANDIVGNTIAGGGMAIEFGSDDNRIVDNDVVGDWLSVDKSRGNLVESNRIGVDAGAALLLDDVEATVVKGNILTAGHGVGVLRVHRATDLLVVGNQLLGSGQSLKLVGGSGILVEANLVQGNLIAEDILRGLRVQGNTLVGGGLDLAGVLDATVVDNTARDGLVGLRIERSSVELRENEIAGSRYAGWIRGGTTLLQENRFLDMAQRGLEIARGANVTLTRNVFADNAHEDLGLDDFRSLTLRDNTFGAGLRFRSVPPAGAAFDIGLSNTVNGKPLRVLDNATGAFSAAGLGQLVLLHAHDLVVEDASFSGTHTALTLLASDNVRIHNATFANNSRGIETRQGGDLVVEGSTFAGNTLAMSLVGSGSIAIRDTLIQGGQTGIFASLQTGARLALVDSELRGTALYGVYLQGGASHEIRGNDFTANLDRAVYMTAAGTLRGNNFWDNGRALTGGSHVDAAHNWWGCAGGPGDAACDTVEGAALVSPWLDAAAPRP